MAPGRGSCFWQLLGIPILSRWLRQLSFPIPIIFPFYARFGLFIKHAARFKVPSRIRSCYLYH